MFVNFFCTFKTLLRDQFISQTSNTDKTGRENNLEVFINFLVFLSLTLNLCKAQENQTHF